MIELNSTLLYQIVGFFALYFVLNALLYKPVLKILEEREKNIAGRKKEALELEAGLQKRMADYEKRLKDAKAKAQEERHRIRQQGIDKEREILENARRDSQDSLAQAKAKLEQDVKVALISLKQESKIISKDIAGKILERKAA